MNKNKKKITPNTPKNESGLTQLTIMGNSIRQICVKMQCVTFKLELKIRTE